MNTTIIILNGVISYYQKVLDTISGPDIKGYFAALSGQGSYI